MYHILVWLIVSAIHHCLVMLCWLQSNKWNVYPTEKVFGTTSKLWNILIEDCDLQKLNTQKKIHVFPAWDAVVVSFREQSRPDDMVIKVRSSRMEMTQVMHTQVCILKWLTSQCRPRLDMSIFCLPWYDMNFKPPQLRCSKKTGTTVVQKVNRREECGICLCIPRMKNKYHLVSIYATVYKDQSQKYLENP